MQAFLFCTRHQAVKPWKCDVFCITWFNFHNHWQSRNSLAKNGVHAILVLAILFIYKFNMLWFWFQHEVFLPHLCNWYCQEKKNSYLHLDKCQWCQISTASTCQAPLYSKLKYDSAINTSLSWSFTPTALFQNSFDVRLHPLAEGCLYVWRENILSAQSNYLVLPNPCRRLSSGKLQDLGISDGSKLTLVPTVEAGLMVWIQLAVNLF